jgi:lipoprotein-releasing system permease protein
MRFEYFLAKRFLVGQRYGVFRLVTTFIAIGGTALGVAALLVTLAVMDGFRTDIQEKILGTQPHIVITSPFDATLPYEPALAEALQSVPGVTAQAPFVSAQALLQSDKKVTGILLRGVMPKQEMQVTRLHEILTHGNWGALEDHGIVLGQELAMAIGAHEGDTLTLLAPQGEGDEALAKAPRIRRYKVAGIFHSGMYEYDSNLAYIALPSAQELLGLGQRITGYGVRLADVDKTQAAASTISNRLGSGFWVRSWQDLNRPLFSAMKLERTVMFIILTLIILVSSFTIISNLLLLTIEKGREIGILQAIGASPSQIARIFLFNGLMVGGGGVSLGLFLGVVITGLLKEFPIIRLPADVYYIDRLPVRLSAQTVESVAACAFLLVLISILYPAYKAHQMDPVQAIRYG